MTPASRRRLAAAALVVGVALTHLWVVDRVLLEDMLGEGVAAPARIDVAFVQELAPAEPPPPPALPPPPAPRAASPAPAASAPQPEPQREPERALEPGPAGVVEAPPAPSSAPAPEPSPIVATAPAADAPLPAAAAAASAPSGAPAFEWPPSTRLSYSLTGDFRGPVQGKARVEWLRDGGRYQVHLDVFVGLDVAPVVARRMSSNGELTPEGLKPLRYDEETRALFRAPRRVTIQFEPDRIELPGGRWHVPVPPGVQDTASQFVQLTWLFTTQPQRLRVGETLTVPLALPRHVDNWVYDVAAQEDLDTPVGRIPTFYVKPRRDIKVTRDLLVEVWFAPSLQYLPVRIRIRQDADTYADLLLERLPQQSAPPAAAPAAPPPARGEAPAILPPGSTPPRGSTR